MSDCGCGGGDACVTKSIVENGAPIVGGLLFGAVMYGVNVVRPFINYIPGEVLVKTATIAVVAAVSSGVAHYYYSSVSSENHLDYFAFIGEADIHLDIDAKCQEGSARSEQFISSSASEHYIFGKGGLDVFILNKANDHLFFSMCSTKIIDGQVSSIYGFDTGNDKIYLFCTKKDVSKQDIVIHSNGTVTYIEVAGKFEKTAIALHGSYDNEEVLDSLVLGERYIDVAGEVCPDQYPDEEF